MTLECYQYKYNDSDSSCSGSYEDCRQLKKCSSTDSSSAPYNCFASAQIESKSINGTSTPKLTIIGSGCWSPHPDATLGCNTKCIGHLTSPSTSRYYCCCTADRCNNELEPAPVKTTAAPIPSKSTPSIDNSFPNFIVIFLVFTVVTLLIGTYFKRRPIKLRRRVSRSCSVGTDFDQTRLDLSNANNHNKAENLNATELNELRNSNNVAILVPFRNSFERNNERMVSGPDGRPRLNDTNNNNNNNNQGDQPKAFPDNSRTSPGQQYHSRNSLIDLNDLELLEVVGSGRFGRVHRAQLKIKSSLDVSEIKSNQPQVVHPSSNSIDDADAIEVISEISVKANDLNSTLTDNELQNNHPTSKDDHIEVAVKVIPTRERQSWQNELEIYNSSRTKHPNVLDFFGWCVNIDTSSHWLCIEYSPRGSLHHYLKANTVNWGEFLYIALGIMRGLSHLHDANVVHRDLKSKNILLRQDLSPCITDFGVAAIMDIDIGSQQKKFLQVGTPRYMSPEILECSIVFGIKNFMKIDIYAVALVIWELLTRCYPFETLSFTGDTYGNTTLGQAPQPQSSQDDGPQPYKLPFEEYVGSDPDIDTMRNVVCKERLRPPLRPEWKFYPIEPVYRSLNESWEYDEDARVSATCFVERIERLYADHHQRLATNENHRPR